MVSKGKDDQMWSYLISTAFNKKEAKDQVFCSSDSSMVFHFPGKKMNSEPEAWNQAFMKVKLDCNLKTQKIKSLVFFSGDFWESYFYSGRIKLWSSVSESGTS